MKKIKYLLAVSVITGLLTGCQFFSESTKPTTPPTTAISQPDNLLLSPPKIEKRTDWNVILSPLVNKLLSSSALYDGNRMILISDIQNRSGQYIATGQVDNVLYTLINQQNIFTVTDKGTINRAKQALGISYDDKLVSRSKMIALAKSMNVDYVLFTTINKIPTDNSDAAIAMELLLTKTGEILQRVKSEQIATTTNSEISNEFNKVSE